MTCPSSIVIYKPQNKQRCVAKDFFLLVPEKNVLIMNKQRVFFTLLGTWTTDCLIMSLFYLTQTSDPLVSCLYDISEMAEL